MPREKESRALTIEFTDEAAIVDFVEKLNEGGILPENMAVYQADGLHLGRRGMSGGYILRGRAPGHGIEELWPEPSPTLKDKVARRAARRRLAAPRT